MWRLPLVRMEWTWSERDLRLKNFELVEEKDLMFRYSTPTWALFALLVCSGCAHTQLRWNTTKQALTLTDIYEQQVMDNLAMFVHDPNSLPSFAYPNAGGSDVTDGGTAGSGTTLKRLGFDQQVLNLGASRNMKEAWTFTPVYDVRRLELMRCAYQQALANAGYCTLGDGCPDCDKLQRAFYLGGADQKYDSDPAFDHLATFSRKKGRTTPACFSGTNWLCCSDSKPKKCDCTKLGHYCGKYVWLAPGGQNELSKLTMVILDYAFTPQATKPSGDTKEVTWFFDENGLPTDRANAHQEMKAVVAFDKKVRLKQDGSELPTDSDDEKASKIRKQLDNVFDSPSDAEAELPPILSPPSTFSPLQFELYRQTLTAP